jgi:DNA polymerase-2
MRNERNEEPRLESADGKRADARYEGCILQSSYRVRAGVPMVHLYGRLTDGRSFLVRDARARPGFYIRAADRVRAVAVASSHGVTVTPLPHPYRSMADEPLGRIEVGVPADVPPLRDLLVRAGIATFEADVRFAVGYLIDRNIRGGCRILGEPATEPGVDLVFDDPELEPCAVEVSPRVLSFDIETDPAADRLLAISLYGLGLDEVLVVDPGGRAMPERAIGMPNERAALETFAERVAACDPDVITGWNVIEFDLAMLARVAARVRAPLRLGRDDATLRVRPAERPFGAATAAISGRVVLDGIDLLRGAFVRQDDYSLDAVARSVLGEGKALTGSATDRVGEILGNYRDDLAAFARYARTDARLALEIVERLKLVELAYARSQLTGMSPDRVAASIASFDFLYLSALHRQGIAAPTVPEGAAHVPQAGGQVLEPTTGLHRLVWVFDFKSLYPSIMRTFNIDPLGYAGVLPDGAVPPEDLIAVPGGASFRRAPGILPGMLDELMPRRDAAKRQGDQVASQAIKILMNSFYGVLGTPACRFHNAAIANAITGLGRHLLTWTQRWFELRGFEVLYGDTDSLFVASGAADAAAAEALGRALVAELNAELAEYVRQHWRVASRLELQFEKLYAQLLLPAMRHGPEGARKRYAGIRASEPADRVEFVGMEVVRRDWTDLAKNVQRGLYQRLFASEPVEAFLQEIVRALRAGELDDQLVYRKGLRKGLASYTAATPPHVAAARKSTAPPGRVIAYVMTTRGPEPLDARHAPPDREHYLERQVRPVAEPVLQTLGLEFDAVIGDATQLALF